MAAPGARSSTVGQGELWTRRVGRVPFGDKWRRRAAGGIARLARSYDVSGGDAGDPDSLVLSSMSGIAARRISARHWFPSNSGLLNTEDMREQTVGQQGGGSVVEQERVVAVVVTWNRRDLLVEALIAIADQTLPTARVVVVDNASDDGTRELLAERFPELDVVRTERNIGGAGGFAVGLQRALAGDCDAVWLMDDDTVPTATALEALVDARARYARFTGETPALVASKVEWTDGRDHPMNTPRRKPGVHRRELYAADAVGCLPIRSASFVSALVDAQTARERGLPIADYFLWNDDFEFTTRLVRDRPALYCPGSVVVHKTARFGSTDADPGGRFYFEVRNKVWLFSRSSGLSPREKAVYGASSLRRWARTLARSGDRKTLLRAAGRGLADGVRTKPRPTSDVIAEAVRDADDG
jgi:rhamnopyranosyl-N-acetylglucosaminyl-diphospho-decaprenol beta-1,3/1,4-galactofuranosyltransferase